MNNLKAILERIKKPLAYAARDNYAHVKSLTDIEPFMRAQAEELRRVMVEPEGPVDFERIFLGFDRLPVERKIERLVQASERITVLEHQREALSTKTAVIAGVLPAKNAELRLDTQIQYCKGIGPKRAELLGKLGIHTIQDALSYLPWRYEDRGNFKKIGRLSYGAYETVSGEVVSAEVASTKRQRVKIFELVITDNSGMLVGSWFNQAFMKKAFKVGQKVILSGVVKANPYKGGLPQIDNPNTRFWMRSTRKISLSIPAGPCRSTAQPLACPCVICAR